MSAIFIFLKPGPRYSWKKVFFILLFSIFSILGAAVSGLYLYHYLKERPGARIEVIVQTGPRYAALETIYLAEAMNLSIDRPVYFNQFDLKEAEDQLRATWVIGEAMLKRVKPNILYIDYSLREPIAELGDYTNTAFDTEGVFFPFTPFYSPRAIPKIYLGEQAPPNPWGEKIEERYRSMILAFLTRFNPSEVQMIDFSQADASSAGKREIVLALKNGSILRFTSKNYPQELVNYFILERTVLKKKLGSYLIDLRIPDIAYLSAL